jgi:hypothetical protein
MSRDVSQVVTDRNQQLVSQPFNQERQLARSPGIYRNLNWILSPSAHFRIIEIYNSAVEPFRQALNWLYHRL